MIWTACKRSHNQYDTICGFRPIHGNTCLYASGSLSIGPKYQYNQIYYWRQPHAWDAVSNSSKYDILAGTLLIHMYKLVCTIPTQTSTLTYILNHLILPLKYKRLYQVCFLCRSIMYEQNDIIILTSTFFKVYNLLFRNYYKIGFANTSSRI